MQDCVSPRIATLAQHDKLNDSRILCTGDAHGNYVIRSNGTLWVQSVHLRKSATRTTKIRRMRKANEEKEGMQEVPVGGRSKGVKEGRKYSFAFLAVLFRPRIAHTCAT